MRIRDRVAIVTGASSGIGRAVASALARRGSRVALLARRREELNAAVGEIVAAGGRALAVPCDVTDAAAVGRAVALVGEELGPPDILVNCAGHHVWRPFAATAEADQRRMMEVNYWGTFNCTRAVLPLMRRRGRGAIVHVAAGSARLPLAITSGFSASKAAVGALSESLRRELRGSGIAVSCVFPASVRTGFWDAGRVDLGRLPPVIRWAPKLSPAAVARQVVWTLHMGFAQRTFPIFLALAVRLDAFWPRLGDLVLSRWGLATLVGMWLLSRVLAG